VNSKIENLRQLFEDNKWVLRKQRNDSILYRGMETLKKKSREFLN
jgi:hypothetical protein